jgi:glycosyltransferase involved in cell wall biosynthesis
MRIGCSGAVSERSGIGTVQKHLYAYLADAGHKLQFSKPRDMGMAPFGKVRGLARGFRPASGPIDVYLSVIPPLPFLIRAPVLTVVHDLRWLRTRSTIGAAYRAWDLRRTVRQSAALVCVSENTRRDLVEFQEDASSKAITQWLGTGLVPDGSFSEHSSGLLMLVGGAAHKRNELAAAALAAARPSWVHGIIGVGVSEHVRDTLSEVFRCEWFDRVSDTEMLFLYRRAEFLVMLGTDEGFGLPFVEAIAAGCQVIATDHPLAREIIGDAGLLLRAGDAGLVGEQLISPPAVPAQRRACHAARFSWEAFGATCEAELVKIAKGDGPWSRALKTD